MFQIETMNMKELKELRSKITARLNDLEGESDLPNDLDQLSGMLDKIDERAAALKDNVQKRAKLLARVATGEEGETVRSGRAQKTGEEEPVDVRASMEYKKAFLRALKSGSDRECRALLSTNATDGSGITGYVPVPTYLEDEIKTAWENHQLLGLVKHSYMKGNVKIGFELSATGADIHLEGTEAPEEEEVELGVLEIRANNIKKWITVSDEALEGTTVQTMNYLLKEISHKIVERAEEIVIAKINAAPVASTSTSVAVAESSVASLDVDTVTMAVAELSGSAQDLRIILNRRTEAALKATAKKAHYGVDPFDGITRVHTDKLKSFAQASSGDTVMIIGDLGRGMQANFPNGDTVMIKTDNLSLANKDLVKLIGRQFVGIEVVAENHIVRVKKA